MILAVDVNYMDFVAVVAGVIFSGWEDEGPEQEIVTFADVSAAYQPGQFYKRELPCILELVRENDLHPDCIIVDGLVYLDGYREPGLGRHLFDALGGRVPVIGVAKSHFRGIPEECAIHRGNSSRPLYVTAAGIDLKRAKECILGMHGDHRIPSLLKRVDLLCRKTLEVRRAR